MGFNSFYFLFFFRNHLSNSQIVDKLSSICYSFNDSFDDVRFKDKFSIVLDFNNFFGIFCEKLYTIGQPVTLLFGSSYEDSFFEFLLKDLFSELDDRSYIDSECNLSLFKHKFGWVHCYALLFNPSHSDSLTSILSSVSEKINTSEFLSNFNSYFFELKENFLKLRDKILNVKISENDIKISLDYYNFKNLLSIMFYRASTNNYYKERYSSSLLASYNSFIPILIKDGILNSFHELEHFYDLSIRKQLELAKSWESRFQDKTSKSFNWEELEFIVSVVISNLYVELQQEKKHLKEERMLAEYYSSPDPKEKNIEIILIENRQKIMSQSAIDPQIITKSKKSELFNNYNNVNSIEYLNYTIEHFQNNIHKAIDTINYSIEVIDEFMLKFKTIIENTINALLNPLNNRYSIHQIQDVMNGTLFVLFGSYNELPDVLSVIPESLLRFLFAEYFILPSSAIRMDKILTTEKEIFPFSLITADNLFHFNFILDLEEFLDLFELSSQEKD